MRERGVEELVGPYRPVRLVCHGHSNLRLCRVEDMRAEGLHPLCESSPPFGGSGYHVSDWFGGGIRRVRSERGKLWMVRHGFGRSAFALAQSRLDHVLPQGSRLFPLSVARKVRSAQAQAEVLERISEARKEAWASGLPARADAQRESFWRKVPDGLLWHYQQLPWW